MGNCFSKNGKQLQVLALATNITSTAIAKLHLPSPFLSYLIKEVKGGGSEEALQRITS